MSAIKHNETAGDKHLPLRSEVGKISKIRRKMNYYGLQVIRRRANQIFKNDYLALVEFKWNLQLFSSNRLVLIQCI